ncbi:VanZ family protein [Mariniflexile ostreae]|uniref:VanZ family protein n=1 Tax=Mariniflexile ostreae TaxID=1520892 RepID=A0ABV5FA28_9FLAO
MLKYFWILSAVAYTALLTTASLINLRGLPSIKISFADKIFHFSAYFVLTILWVLAFFYNFNYKKTKALKYVFIISVSFGIFIEVLQGALTTVRSFDIYDMMANTLGALLAVVALSFYNFKNIKKL